MTRLEPPPRISSGSPVASASRAISTISSVFSASTSRRAGPPMRRVVCSESGTSLDSCTSDTLCELYDGPRHAQYLLATAGRGDVDPYSTIVELRADNSADRDLAAGIQRDNHRLGEPNAVLDDRTRVADPVGHDPGSGGHREHPVRDHV